jgi:O-antigen/teichoic acid export membrane protein
MSRFPTIVQAARSLLVDRRDVVTSGAWSLAVRLGGLISTFALGVVLARVLGPVQFGIYGLVTSVATLAMTVALLGTPQFAVRELSVAGARGEWARAKAIIYRLTGVTAAAGLVIAILALLAAAAAGRSASILGYVLEGALLMILMGFTALWGAALRGLGAILKGQSMDNFMRPGAAFLFVLALILVGQRFDPHLALWIQIGVTAAAAAISLIWLWGAVPKSRRHAAAGGPVRWAAAALPLGVVDVLRQLDGTFGIIIVGWLSSGVELGVFRVAVACAAVTAMPMIILHVVVAPRLSRLNHFGEKAELQRVLTWVSATMIAIMLPMTIMTFLFSKAIIGLVFGEAYGPAWLPLSVMTLAYLTHGLFGMGAILLAMCGGERALARIYLLAVGAAIAAGVPLILLWGGAGAAAAQIISAFLIGTLSRRYGRQTLGVEVTLLGAKARAAP